VNEPGDVVGIFAPSILASVTIEVGASDELEIHVHPAGQGYWVARMLAVLGARPRLCCTAGGELGTVARLRVEDGIDLVVVDGPAAAGGYVDDRRSGQRVRIAEMRSTPLERHAVDDLVSATMAAGVEAGVAVLTGSNLHGSVPVGTYRSLAGNLRAVGVRVVADLGGDELEAVVEGGTDVVKVSSEELVTGGLAAGDSPDDLLAAAAELAQRGAGLVVVTTAHEGVTAVDSGGLVARARGPQLEPVEPRGAGDSFTAGLALGMRRNAPLADTLRLGIAAATVNVTRHGLGSGDRAVVERLMEQVDVER
jgi:1-phosphofructokinase